MLPTPNPVGSGGANSGAHSGAGYADDAGVQAFLDGFQVHVPLAGWGENNEFADNDLEVNAAGAGIWLQKEAVGQGNVIRCSNLVTGALSGDYGSTNHDPTTMPMVSCTN